MGAIKRKQRAVQPSDELSDDDTLRGTPDTSTPLSQSSRATRRLNYAQDDLNGSSSRKSNQEREDTLNFEQEQENPIPSDRNKKRRADRSPRKLDGRSSQRAETVEPSEPDESVPTPFSGRLTQNGHESLLQRDKDGFLPGSIVHVTLKNFVTYEDVDFYPCPHLNMIIGPNGTGKSTLVCAIALGLGFPPSVLDRAPDIKLYVKLGAEAGSIETELKGYPGKKNHKIKLLLQNDSNVRNFEIDGKKSTLAAVQELVKSFNIQVDNLCCFLPQDKVSKFAELKEDALLKETQKVAGHPKLSEWHDKLIQEGKHRMELEGQLKITRSEHQDLEKRLTNLQVDVDRLEQRQQIENQIAMLEFALENCRYLVNKRRFEELKQEWSEAKEKVDQLEKANHPLEQQQKHFDHVKQQYQACRDRLEEEHKRARSACSSLESKLKAAGTKTEEASDQLAQSRQDESRRKERLAMLSQELEQLAQRIQVVVEKPNLKPLEQESSSLAQRMRAINTQLSNLKTQQTEVYQERQAIQTRQSEITQEIEELQSVSSKQEANMRQYVPKLFQALEVMRTLRQQRQFSGSVFEPIRLVISAKESKFAKAIESCMNLDLLNTFVCTHPQDYDLMAVECNEKRKLRVNIVCLMAGDSMSNYPRPRPPEEIRQFGFDDYAIDLIDGPDPVLAHLCSHARLNTIPVAHQADEPVDTTPFDARNSAIRSWIIGDYRSMVSFSSYGSREKAVRTAPLSNPKILNLASVDMVAIRERTIELKQQSTFHAEKQAFAEQLRAQEKELRDQHEQMQKAREAIDTQKKQANQAHMEYIKRCTQHRTKLQELEHERRQPSLEETRRERKARLRAACLSHYELALKYKDAFCQLSQVSTALTTLNLRIFQLESDRRAFNRTFNEMGTELQSAKEACAHAETRKKAAHREAQEMSRNLQTTIQSDELLRDNYFAFKAEFDARGERFEEHIVQDRLDHEREALEIIHPVDQSVLLSYKKLKAQFEEETARLESLESKSDRINKKIQAVHDTWRSHLNELINSIDEKFDAAFKRMGCLGHVAIREDADYDKWGIEIQVSFRDNEPMMRLDAQRQSGGERSLSTIMYLMSLTELGKAPFSLVDEINQGMDRRSERLVHDQLVEITCKESASQYFLITPKLLLGLRYHPLMRVLCVNNGDWLPQDFKFKPWLDRAKAAIAGRRAITNTYSQTNRQKRNSQS